MRVLILEDNRDRRVAMVQRLLERFPFLDILFFESAPEMIEFMNNDSIHDIVLIVLDNDLEMIPTPSGEWIDPGTGLDVALWLSQHAEWNCPIVIHTTNSKYAEKIITCLTHADKVISRVVPYGDMEWIDREWFQAVRKAIVQYAPVLTSNQPVNTGDAN